MTPDFRLQPGHEATLNQLRSAVSRQPGESKPLEQLAAFLHQAEEHRAAELVLRRALALDPRNEPALGLLGITAMRLGHYSEAEAMFQRLIDVIPESWNGHHHMGVLQLRRRRFDESERFLLAARERGPDVFWPHRALGLLRFRQDRPEEALAHFDRAKEIDPKYPSIDVYRMHCLERLGREEEAQQAYLAFLSEHTRGTSNEPVRLLYGPQNDEQPAGGLHFLDVAPQLGLDSPARGRAAAWEDLDGDGAPELILGFLEETSRLYLNRDGGGRFEERSEPSGLLELDSAYGLDLADFDNDGRIDLYVTRGGFQNGRRGRDANALLLGQGGGRFQRGPAESGAEDTGMGFGATPGDFDRDGWLDLFVVNSNESNRLLRNLGTGRFEDLTGPAGLQSRENGTSALAADFDDDGDLDLFVANNGDNNRLYRNDTPVGGPMRFVEVGFEARVGLSGGFGSATGDFDNDGRIDIVVANMNNWTGGSRFSPGDPCYLFLNRGELRFEEKAIPAGLNYVGGATAPLAADFDADGWLDLYLATGGPEPGRHESDLLYRNLGVGRGTTPRFAEITRAAGIYRLGLSGRGPAVADYDGDGDLDLFVPGGTHVETEWVPDALWQNQGHSNHWLQLELQGRTSNRAAIGARVTVKAGELLKVAEVGGSSGWGGHSELALYFGLGARDHVDEVVVRWPDGREQRPPVPPVDGRARLIEGQQGWTRIR